MAGRIEMVFAPNLFFQLADFKEKNSTDAPHSVQTM